MHTYREMLRLNLNPAKFRIAAAIDQARQTPGALSKPVFEKSILADPERKPYNDDELFSHYKLGMMRMIIRILLPVVLAISWIGVADARMYRWIDEDGTTVYSQSPPASGEAAEIKINTSTAPTGNKAEDETPAASDNPSQADTQQPAEGPSKAEIAESNRIKSENCASARHNLDLYSNLGNRLVKTPDGLYKRLTEEERQQKIADSKTQIGEFCGK